MNPEVSKHLSQYKSMIDFSDLTQKQNFKWISGFIGQFHKKLPESEIIRFLREAMDLQTRYLSRGMWLFRTPSTNGVEQLA